VLRVYFDSCCLNRPLDDRSQPRIALEAEAVLEVLKHWEAGGLALISSEVLTLEADNSKQPDRRAYVRGILDRADEFVAVDASIAARAKELESVGFRAMDALHLACAESVSVDEFSTCDDRLLKKARSRSDLKVSVNGPLQLFDKVFP
jgi:predicted nucleic acid-binding protein